MFSKLAWIEEASLRAHCTQLLEQALSSCANTEASATAIVANASTSVEDDSDFFNFMIIKSSPTPPSQAHLEFLNENRTELSNVGQTSRNQTIFVRYNTCLPSSASDYSIQLLWYSENVAIDLII